MRKLVILACAALVASPVTAATDKSGIGAALGAPIDMLYPEISVDDDGWRGLLPVILYNVDELADNSRLDAPVPPSERDDER